MVGCTPGGRGYGVTLDGGKGVVERRDVVCDEASAGRGGRNIHCEDGGGLGVEGAGVPARPGTPANSRLSSPGLSPSTSGTMSGAEITPDVQAAVGAARLLTRPGVPDADSTEEEEERRYPGRARVPPLWFSPGGEGVWGGSNAAAVVNAEVGPDVAPTPVGKMEVLRPPPKTVREARKRPEWAQWKAALKVEL